MKFRRKSAAAPHEAGSEAEVTADEAAEAPESGPTTGPYDADGLPEGDDVVRMDLGSMRIAPVEGCEIRLQVDEATDTVEAVLLAGTEGALELRAFAAPRNGDLWSEVRPKIAADFAQRGGTADERDGRFGPELVCRLTVRTPDGATATQPSRIIGINGPRWMLRATLLGRPALEPEGAGAWEDAIAQVIVDRGSQPMPSGGELPLRLPREGTLIEHPGT